MTKISHEGKFNVYRPTKNLEPYILEYWTLKLEKSSLHQKFELEQPSLNHEIIFKFGQDFEEYYPKTKSLKLQQNTTVSWLRSYAKASRRVDTNQKLFLIGVKFHALGSYSFFDVPLNELFDQVLTLDEIKMPILFQLEEQLAEMKGDSTMIRYLNNFFSDYFGKKQLSLDARKFYSRFDYINLISHQYNQRAQCNYKYLERKFKKYIGTTPKKCFKLNRYLSFYDSWFLEHKYNYIEKVYENDYFDQSHLIKDFKTVLDIAPSKFLKEMNEFYTQHIKRVRILTE